MSAGSTVPHFKRGVVVSYLSRHFPDSKLGESFDHDENLYVFRLSRRGSRVTLAVTVDFFERRRVDDIANDLEHLNITAALHTLRDVILSNDGVRKRSA